jgi:hypothetical protein
MALSPSQIDSIARQVYRQFPEVKDARPAVQSQATSKAPTDGPGRYLLTFRAMGQGAGGRSIPRIVRVVTDERGKVLKMSTSR